MKKLIKRIEKINKGYLSYFDILKLSDMKEGSLRVKLSRMVKNEEIQKIGNGLYSVDTSKIEYGQLACEIYPSSYLSLEYVLAINGILSQQPSNLTLVTLNRAKKIDIGGLVIIYQHINKILWWGYELKDGVLIAKPEKALIDLVYLSLNGYAYLDWEELNLNLLDIKILQKYLNKLKKVNKKVGEKIEKVILDKF